MGGGVVQGGRRRRRAKLNYLVKNWIVRNGILEASYYEGIASIWLDVIIYYKIKIILVLGLNWPS